MPPESTPPPDEHQIRRALDALGVEIPKQLEAASSDDPAMRSAVLAALAHRHLQRAVHTLIRGDQDSEAPGAFIRRLAAVAPQGWPLPEDHAVEAVDELSWTQDRLLVLLDADGEGAAPYTPREEDPPVDAHAAAAAAATEIARDLVLLRRDPDYYGAVEETFGLIEDRYERLSDALAAVAAHHTGPEAPDPADGRRAEHDHGLIDTPTDVVDLADHPVDHRLIGEFLGAGAERCTTCQDSLLTLIVEDAATCARLVELACMSVHERLGGLPRSLLADDAPGVASHSFRALARAGADGNNTAMFGTCAQMSPEQRREAANTAADLLVGGL